MGLWGNKSKNESPSDGFKGVKKKKAAGLLSSVIEETVIGSAVGIMNDNPKFQLDENHWMVIMLPADNIGGLSDKHKNDEDKGSLVELIRADAINVLATQSMLSQNIFSIIPTEDTVEQMSEFSLLVDAEYMWALVSVDDEDDLKISTIDDKGQPKKVDFETVEKISKGEMSLADAGITVYTAGLAEVDSSMLENETIEEEPIEESGLVDDGQIVEEESFEEEPIEDEVIYEDDEPAFDEEDPVYEDESFEEEYIEPNEGFDVDPSEMDEVSEDVDVVESEPVVRDDKVVTEQEVIDGLQNRYMSEDLKIGVSLDRFNQYFNPNQGYFQFGISSAVSDSPYAITLSNMEHRANAEIKAMHDENIETIRKLYLGLVDKYIQGISETLDTTDDNSIYGGLFKAAAEDYNRNIEADSQKAKEEREKLREEFEKNKEAVGESAAIQAKNKYQEQYGGILEERVRNVEADLQAVSAEKFRENKAYLFEMRRLDAQRHMDEGERGIFAVVEEEWKKLHEKEINVQNEWKKHIDQYINSNLAEDEKRMSILEKKLEQDRTIEKMRKDFDKQMQRMREETNARVEQSEQELRRAREDTIEKLKAQEQEWMAKMDQSTELQEQANKVSNKLMKSLRQTQELEQTRFNQKLQELESDKNRMLKDAEKDKENQAKNFKLVLVIMFILVVMALIFGVLVGVVWSGSRVAPASVMALDLINSYDTV